MLFTLRKKSLRPTSGFLPVISLLMKSDSHCFLTCSIHPPFSCLYLSTVFPFTRAKIHLEISFFKSVQSRHFHPPPPPLHAVRLVPYITHGPYKSDLYKAYNSYHTFFSLYVYYSLRIFRQTLFYIPMI